MGFGFDFGFRIFGILFVVMFMVVMGIFIVTLGREIREWNQNNHSPRLTVPATVIAKRTNVSHSSHGGTNGHHHHSTSTTYYVTFQVDSGDRMELYMAGHKFGLLLEGDRGNLTFQGTRYLGFERI